MYPLRTRQGGWAMALAALLWLATGVRWAGRAA
jgi:hypothetical protein